MSSFPRLKLPTLTAILYNFKGRLQTVGVTFILTVFMNENRYTFICVTDLGDKSFQGNRVSHTVQLFNLKTNILNLWYKCKIKILVLKDKIKFRSYTSTATEYA